jgi:DNA polymerase-3 subunit alpha
MQEFTHLHVHTVYSLLDGYSPLDRLLDEAKAHGMEALAITDHGNMHGVVQFYKEAKKRGINPILGCEVYTAFADYREKDPKDRGQYHLVLLAENETGFKNLMHIVSEGYVHGFYYRPRVDRTVLRKYKDGIIATSACLGGELPGYGAICARGKSGIYATESTGQFPPPSAQCFQMLGDRRFYRG